MFNRKPNRTRRAIRLPNEVLRQLRDLRDSYITPRAVSDLIRTCLRNKYVVVDAQKQQPATRENSETTHVWLDPEYATWSHKDIVAKVLHVLAGMADKTNPAENAP